MQRLQSLVGRRFVGASVRHGPRRPWVPCVRATAWANARRSMMALPRWLHHAQPPVSLLAVEAGACPAICNGRVREAAMPAPQCMPLYMRLVLMHRYAATASSPSAPAVCQLATRRASPATVLTPWPLRRRRIRAVTAAGAPWLQYGPSTSLAVRAGAATRAERLRWPAAGDAVCRLAPRRQPHRRGPGPDQPRLPQAPLLHARATCWIRIPQPAVAAEILRSSTPRRGLAAGDRPLPPPARWRAAARYRRSVSRHLARVQGIATSRRGPRGAPGDLP